MMISMVSGVSVHVQKKGGGFLERPEKTDGRSDLLCSPLGKSQGSHGAELGHTFLSFFGCDLEKSPLPHSGVRVRISPVLSRPPSTWTRLNQLE